MATVLVVDDDARTRAAVAAALDGHQLLYAGDGTEALDLLQRQRVDVLVAEVGVARVDGLEVVRRVRGDTRLSDLPVVLLTDRVSEDDHLRGYQAGADAYVTKPFDAEELASTVAEVRARPPEQRERTRESEKAKAALLRQVERRFR